MPKPTDNLNYKIIGTLKTREIKDFFVDDGKDSPDFQKLKTILGKVYNVISIRYLDSIPIPENQLFVVDEYMDEAKGEFLFIHNMHVQWFNPKKKEKQIKHDVEA